MTPEPLHLEISRGADSWLCRTVAPASEVAQTRALFGTDTLPTPFFPHVPAETVLARLAKTAPGATVTVSEA